MPVCRDGLCTDDLRQISYFVYGERVTKQAIVGTFVAFIGMVLLFV